VARTDTPGIGLPTFRMAAKLTSFPLPQLASPLKKHKGDAVSFRVVAGPGPAAEPSPTPSASAPTPAPSVHRQRPKDNQPQRSVTKPSIARDILKRIRLLAPRPPVPCLLPLWADAAAAAELIGPGALPASAWDRLMAATAQAAPRMALADVTRALHGLSHALHHAGVRVEAPRALFAVLAARAHACLEELDRCGEELVQYQAALAEVLSVAAAAGASRGRTGAGGRRQRAAWAARTAANAM
jgi:hypothetical protein